VCWTAALFSSSSTHEELGSNSVKKINVYFLKKGKAEEAPQITCKHVTFINFILNPYLKIHLVDRAWSIISFTWHDLSWQFGMKHRLLQATATQVACTMCILQSLWVDLPALRKHQYPFMNPQFICFFPQFYPMKQEFKRMCSL